MKENNKNPWKVDVVTLFPELFPGPLAASLTGQALTKGLWHLNTINLREFGLSKHRSVDDTPFGGGAGMIIRSDVIDSALTTVNRNNRRIIYLSPRGKPLKQRDLKAWSAEEGIILLCGRYEGIDQRVIDHWQMEEVSIGDFVLTGGELAAFCLIDGVVRLIPGVLGDYHSTEEESFSNNLLEYPHYTRPQVWNAMEVPEVLISGNHAKIAEWRKKMSEDITKKVRPDLWEEYIKHK